MLIDGHIVRAARRPPRFTGTYGVAQHEPERCFEGYTLFSPAWGHLALLIDMKGLVVHTWSVTRSNLSELLPGDGRLLTHNVGHWIEELRPDSSVAWRWPSAKDLDHATHHDFWVGPESVWTLAKRREPVIPGFYEPGLEPETMRGDLILEIGRRDGEIRSCFALSEHLEELSALAGLRWPVSYRKLRANGELVAYGPEDWAHANSLELLPRTPLGERDERFRAGNLLISLRNLDLIAVFDPRREAFVWCWGLGVLDAQHQPTMLANGRLLIFDNGSHRGHSVVREIDPPSGETLWLYEEPGVFYSPKRGGAQRLPNGNTLICEGDTARLFEVTPEKEIVWQYWSPFMSQGSRHLGRRIYRATRYSPEQARPLLAARADRIAGHWRPGGRKIETLLELLELYRRGWS